MSRVIVDETLRNKLGNLLEPLYLCDESGRVLARVVPCLIWRNTNRGSR